MLREYSAHSHLPSPSPNKGWELCLHILLLFHIIGMRVSANTLSLVEFPNKNRQLVLNKQPLEQEKQQKLVQELTGFFLLPHRCLYHLNIHSQPPGPWENLQSKFSKIFIIYLAMLGLSCGTCLHSLTFFFLHSHLSSFVSTLLRAAWWSDSLQIWSTSNLSVAPKRQASLLVFSDTKGLVFQKMPLFLRGLDGPGNPILSKRTLLTGTGKGTPSLLHSPSPFLTIVLSTQGTLST